METIQLKDRIKQLEAQAKRLEPDSLCRAEWLEATAAHADRFVESLPERGVFRRDAGESEAWSLGLDDSSADLNALLETLDQFVDRPGINPASGGHMGYIPGGGLFPSAMGDFLADVTNRYSGVSFASPGAAHMELELVSWMADLVGYGSEAGGHLTSGGSVANLGAVVTAREAHSLAARDIPNACVYFTSQAHHCVSRALRVAGLGEARVRHVAMDARFRMDADALERAIVVDRNAGLNPFLVVASAGTTDTGAVDPSASIAQIAQAHGMWFHLDAAYGGFFLLCDEGRAALGDLSGSHSLVMDPHKGLFLPYGSGALLVRDVNQLASAHSYSADYMQDATAEAQRYSPADLSVELSRPFRGLRLWLPLRLFGLAAFRAALTEKLLLARYFHERLSEQPGWQIGPSPELSVVTFRYLPAAGDPEEFNRALLKSIHDDGRVFITSTRLQGEFTLRSAILHYRTHLQEVDLLLDLLAHHARRLEQSS